MADVFVTAADLSRGATWLAYATLTPGDEVDHEQLWIRPIDADTGGPIEIDLPDAATGLAWSSVADVLAVGVRLDGVRQIVLVEPDGSWRQLTRARRGVAGAFGWSPDGTELAAAVLHDQPPPDARRVAAIDGVGPVAAQVSDIHLVDTATGATRAVTDGPALDRTPVFDPSGDRVLFCRSYEPDTVSPDERPLLVDRDGVVEPIAWTASAMSSMTSTVDGRMVFVSTRQSDRTRGVPASLYVCGRDGSLFDRTDGLDLHLLLSTLGDQPSTIEDPRRFVGIHRGDAIVGVCRQGRSEVVRIALDGPIRATTVLDGDRGCHPLALEADMLLFAESTMHGPPTLRLLDLDTGDESTIVDPNPTRQRPTLAVHPIDVVSHGDPIQAWFVASTDRPSGPLPTVLIVHGGPYESFGHTFYGDAHLLADAGYGVVLANPHGSIGYGADFATSIFGRPGVQEIDDLLAAVDRAVELGLADADRLAVCGLSWGGYMSAVLAARTDRFRAAVIENPMIDLVTFRATSDIGPDLLDELVEGTPDEFPDRYRDASPLHDADRCRTPSLLILGEHDLRCPPSQGLQFRDALRRTGCVTDVVWLPGAAHADSAFGAPAVRVMQDRVLLDWMRRYNPV